MCAVDLRPTAMVEGKGFRRFVKNLNPIYCVPSSNTIGKYVGLIYAELKVDVINELAGNDVAFTTDMWTSTAHHDYMTLTCHYINSPLQLKSRIIATRPLGDKHTANNIAEMIRAIAAEFRVRSVITITTDNASNMVACGKLLAADGIIRISCFAHSLQLAVNEGLNVPVISKMIAFAKRAVSHFSRSQPATRALLDHQGRMNAPKILNLIRDVETRWNSTYMLMKRLIQIRAHVHAVLYDETITKPTDRMSLDIKDSTWKVMELVLTILEPFVEATNMLTNDSLPTLGSQYVLIKALTDRIQVDELDSGCERDLKKVIASSFMKRFNVKLDGSLNVDVIKDSLHLICSFLDPRYKTLRSLSVEQREIVQDRVVEMMNVAHFEVPTVKCEPDDPPQSKHNLMDCLAGDFVDLTDAIDVTSQEIELEKYIVEPVAVSFLGNTLYDFHDLFCI